MPKLNIIKLQATTYLYFKQSQLIKCLAKPLLRDLIKFSKFIAI